MVVIAVAGGSGNLGKTIVQELVGHPNHKVIVLSRKGASNQPAVEGAVNLAIDYNDVDDTAKLLSSNNVHTIISTIQVMDATSSSAQVNLVQAADKSETTKRFVASDWSIQSAERSPLYSLREAAKTELRKTDLQWTQFVNGYFLDYYGIPHVKTNLSPLSFVVDMTNKVAAIPGTGDEPMAFTYTYDLAKFVAAFLDLSEWDETTYCYSEKTTWNKFVKLAEEARGSKFSVTYDPAERLEKGEITELPSHPTLYPFLPKQMLQGLFALLGQYILEGRYDLPAEKSLNAKFPDIQTFKVSDMVGLWKGK